MIGRGKKIASGLAVVAALGAATACGNSGGAAQPAVPSFSGPSSTPSSAPATSSAAPANSSAAVAPPTAGTPVQTGPAKCTVGTLKAAVQYAGAGAGQRYAQLILTNTGGQTCTIYGYAGMQLYDAAGNPAPTAVSRVGNPGPATITVNPGGSATAKAHWTQVSSGDEPVTAPCEPDSTSAAITPPDETHSLKVSYAFGNVCAKGQIELSAFYAM